MNTMWAPVHISVPLRRVMAWLEYEVAFAGRRGTRPRAEKRSGAISAAPARPGTASGSGQESVKES